MRGYRIRMRSRLCFAVAACAITLFDSCSTWKDPSDFESAPLYGMVYDERKQPCSGVEIRIDRPSNVYLRSITDVNGRFMAPHVRRGKHILFLSKPGYEPREIVFEFLNRTQVFHVRMVSGAKLLLEFEQALLREHLDAAREYAVRISKVGGFEGIAVFLHALLAYKRGEYREALARLDGLESRSYRSAVRNTPATEQYDQSVTDAFRRHLITIVEEEEEIE
jgi:hypothetical protein